MKYQVLRPHFFSMVGWWVVGWGGGGGLGWMWGACVLVRDVVGGGGRMGGGMGDSGEEGGLWCGW